ncbi:MAG TPA: ATP-binding cassette domain-containing protein [Steroidobacteraceae bacterium]|nr:ATP-binding cassette domain-containing protein [Steroidobacteraceae bacterium]
MTVDPAVESAVDAAVLRVDRVTRRFRAAGRSVTALDAVSAEVSSGAVTGLIGPDGAGKTTFLRLCTGLLQPDEGRVEVFGIDVGRDPEAVRARIGYMPQRFGLYEDLTVRENLELYADLQGVALDEREGRRTELLHMTGLGPFLGRLAGRLSGGMKQKLGLACTLVQIPEMLFLDEPTVGVDPVSRRELWEIIDHLVSTRHLTVLVSTSYLDEAERCRSVLLLHEGHLIGADAPAHFTAQVAGRSFLAGCTGVGKRRLQERLARMPGVLDATIQGASVRIVATDADAATARAALRAQMPAVDLRPVPPRFEDSFIAMLKTDVRTVGSPASAGSATTPSDGEPVIVAAHLTRRFGDFVAVNDLSFTVGRGEIFGLLGANGAGKSTTFRMLCGLLPSSAGELRVAGYDLRRAAAPARGRIGYMAQRFSLYGDLSVLENLSFFSAAYRLSGARRQARIAWALEEFGLGAVADGASRDLPLGFKQRLALACALLHEPDILFLDEPTSGVDPLARREFWRRINALAEGGVTVLVTTHFMEEAEYCDRLAIMAQGRLLATGDPDGIKARTRSASRPEPTLEDAFIDLLQTDIVERAA